ncbi:hypothetical protein [Burkholderia seminalis]|uniref:hypothetical protein n=1 Tax=Burkholderia seminalis TaxID=488731 RepID=UPI0015828AD1|nr:hypothetical protein [Burkholderia seminalis]MCA8432187.1 hypothetical protein [Burkholderia seminalis]
MLKKIVWSENSIFNVKLSENLFTIAQMRCNHLMQFFDVSSEDGAWSGVDLNTVPELFSIYVAENKLKPILVEKIDESRVAPNLRPAPKLMLSLRIDGSGEFGADLIELSDTYSVDGKKSSSRNFLLRRTWIPSGAMNWLEWWAIRTRSRAGC